MRRFLIWGSVNMIHPNFERFRMWDVDALDSDMQEAVQCAWPLV